MLAEALSLLQQKTERTSTGCLLWKGYLDRDGYGSIRVDRKTVQVHRLAYEAARGPAPFGLVIDHLCHTESTCRGGVRCPHRRCVELSHMELVTRAENSSRMWQARKPACVNGHVFDETNTYYRPRSGRRDCRACIRNRVARYKSKRSAA